MSSVRRVYVEKKPDFAVQAKDLKHEIHSYLGISEVTGVRVLIRYDVEHISDKSLRKHAGLFFKPPVDTLYREKVLRPVPVTGCFPWNFFRDSLTREQILPFSV